MINIINRISEETTLTPRPQPMAVEYRPLWRIAQLVLILDYCGRGGKCSSTKISAISWGLQTNATRKNIALLAEGRLIEMDAFAIRFDPTVVRVINLSCGLNFTQRTDSKMIELTESGTSMAKAIRSEGNLFSIEKVTLEKIGKSTLTEKVISSYISDPRL